MLSNFFGLFLLTLALPFTAWAEPHAHVNRHRDVARRVQGDMQVFKRFSNARWTFYDVGLGACGLVNVPSDFIVALNSAQFGGGYPGPNCFKMISMTYNGKSTKAQITDECPGCPYGGLDLSRGLFDFFAAESVGVLEGVWSFIDGSDGGDDSPPPPKTTKKPDPPKTTEKPDPPKTTEKPDPPKTTEAPPPPPPQTSEKPKPPPPPPSSSSSKEEAKTTSTSTSAKPTSSSSTPSSTSTTPSSTVVPTSTINYQSGAAAGLAVPTGTVDNSGKPQNINNMNKLFVNIGGLVMAGSKV